MARPSLASRPCWRQAHMFSQPWAWKQPQWACAYHLHLLVLPSGLPCPESLLHTLQHSPAGSIGTWGPLTATVLGCCKVGLSGKGRRMLHRARPLRLPGTLTPRTSFLGLNAVLKPATYRKPPPESPSRRMGCFRFFLLRSGFHGGERGREQEKLGCLAGAKGHPLD